MGECRDESHERCCSELASVSILTLGAWGQHSRVTLLGTRGGRAVQEYCGLFWMHV